jgi:hypothetical protein
VGICVCETRRGSGKERNQRDGGDPHGLDISKRVASARGCDLAIGRRDREPIVTAIVNALSRRRPDA